MSDSSSMKSPVAPGDIVAGKYRVERVLGSGGMGVVVAARHIDLDQLVALKFILPQSVGGKGNIERFMREARAAVRLKSEHVAKVYDVGRDGEDRPFMVLELLEGMDLAKLTRTRGSLAVADAVEYVLQACEALVEAHAAGIVHRDLKPQNLFVTRRLNGVPLVKVLDFGIAKAVGPEAAGQMALTDSSAIIGSPLYMAPEQMRSARTADIRSDVWALGVILYELLGGQLPFEGETVTEVCIRVVNESPPALAQLRPALDPALVAVVMRCLEKDPERRFHNVSALAASLEPFSRSAKQGGPVRPWRSFEDTQDSGGGANPFAGDADATGPSTPVTIGSTQPLGASPQGELSDDERRARAEAGSTQASAGSRPPLADERHALVSTDVAWGESAERRATAAPPARSFSAGMVAAIAASVAALAIIVGLLLGRRSAPATPPSHVAASASAEVDAKAKSDAEARARAEAEAKAKSEAKVEVDAAGTVEPFAARATSTPSASTATRGSSHPKARGGGRPADPASAAPASAPPSASARPEPKTGDPVSPNGAPILH